MENGIKNSDELKELIIRNKKIKFRIKVVAGSKINQAEFLEDYIKIKIKQRAVEGKANKAIIEYLSEILGIAKTKIEIVSGQTSSLKIIEVDIS